MQDNETRTSALALRPSRHPDDLQKIEESEWQRPDWQKLWLATQSQPWRSLALVPAGHDGDAEFTVKIAVLLARTGMLHLGTPIQVADGTRVPLSQLVQFSTAVDSCIQMGDRVIIALSSAAASPNTVSLAQKADVALGCIQLGRTKSSDIKETIKAVGAKHFLGVATFPV